MPHSQRTKETSLFWQSFCLQASIFISGEWVCEARHCFQEFREKFTGVVVLEAFFLDFCSIKRKLGSRTLVKRTPEAVEIVQQVMVDN